MAKKNVSNDIAADPRYHDTLILLKKYRDVVWSLELAVKRAQGRFEQEFGRTISEFLDSVYQAGVELGDTRLEEQARNIDRTYRMLSAVNTAVDLIRKRHKDGETYYWILYYSYLSPHRYPNLDMILQQLEPHIGPISARTFYRKRKEAVSALSSALWGYTARDSLRICHDFLDW